MTYFRDLTPCDYGASFSGLTHLLAVGWLEPPFDIPRGVVKRAMRDRLQALCGSTNILILGRDVVYVTPELILHYIDEHQFALRLLSPVLSASVRPCRAKAISSRS